MSEITPEVLQSLRSSAQLAAATRSDPTVAETILALVDEVERLRAVIEKQTEINTWATWRVGELLLLLEGRADV